MNRNMIHKQSYRLIQCAMALLIGVAPFLFNEPLFASEFGRREINIGSSRPGVTTLHEVSFEYISPDAIGSLVIEYCQNTPLFDVGCTAPTGFDISGAVLSSESGETGFSVDPATNVNRLLLTRVSSPVTTLSPSLSSYLISSVVNPSVTGTSYARMASYASVDGSGARIDEGGIALSYNNPVSVGAYVPPFLLFCVGTTIPTNNCASASGNNIDFGEFNTVTPSFGTVQMLAATNGDGYTIRTTGTTMTSGNNVIPATNLSASVPNTSQFGYNLRNNSQPDVGANRTGSGNGVPTARYNSVDRFSFSPNEVIVSSPRTSNINKFTASFIVNINGDQAPGVYATTLTFTALADF